MHVSDSKAPATTGANEDVRADLRCQTTTSTATIGKNKRFVLFAYVISSNFRINTIMQMYQL
jgi:hypothetical protein